MTKYYALMNDRDTLFNFLKVLFTEEDVEEYDPIMEDKYKSRIPSKVAECNRLIDEYVRLVKEKKGKNKKCKKAEVVDMDKLNADELKKVSHELSKKIFDIKKRIEKLQEA